MVISAKLLFGVSILAGYGAVKLVKDVTEVVRGIKEIKKQKNSRGGRT